MTDDRRRSHRVVSGEAEVAYRTADRGGRIEDDNGVAVVVMDKVPACVENPADRDISVVVESAVGQIGDERAECKLGEAEAAAQICSAGASQEDCAKLLAPRLPQQRNQKDENSGDEQGRQKDRPRERDLRLRRRVHVATMGPGSSGNLGACPAQ
jgi:hypothetical protein